MEFINNKMSPTDPKDRWFLVILGPLIIGGIVYYLLNLWCMYIYQIAGMNLEALLIVLTLPLFSMHIFISVGTAIAPNNKRRTCILLTILSFIIASMFSSLKQRPENLVAAIVILAILSGIIGFQIYVHTKE